MLPKLNNMDFDNDKAVPFKVVAPFEPMGDQPQAVEDLAAGIENGQEAQVLLGATGTGKTFTIAKLIEKVQRPTLVIAHNKTLAAHCVHLSLEEAQILSETQTTIVHNPCSNMKLASGVFNSLQAQNCGCNIALGTDGTSSNNNLSMIEEMKFASLLAKSHYGNPQAGKASEIMQWATRNGAKAMGLNAGEVKEGKLADLIFVNLDNERLLPDNDLVSSMVYSADSRCIDSVMCNGNFLMKRGYIEAEQEIIEEVRQYNKHK